MYASRKIVDCSPENFFVVNLNSITQGFQLANNANVKSGKSGIRHDYIITDTDIGLLYMIQLSVNAEWKYCTLFTSENNT